jgi:uncharacterized membrane protein
MAGASSALFLVYPLVVHYCAMTGQLNLAAWYLAAILAVPLLTNILARKRIAVSSLIPALMSIALLTVFRSNEIIIFKLLPVSIYAALFIVFFSSLQAESTPAITRIALTLRGALSPRHAAYTRRLTVAWSVFFLVMGVISGATAVFASDTAWSWFVNIVSYGLTAGFFLAEFFVRKRVLRDEASDGLIEFFLDLARLDLRELLRSR